MPSTWIDRAGERILALAAEDDDAGQEAKIRAFTTILLLHLTARMWLWALPADRAPAELKLGFAAIFSALVIGAFRSRWQHTALIGVAALLGGKVVASFPHVSNHAYLELGVVGLLLLLRPDRAADRELLLRSLRWVVVLVLFHTGLQKVLWGTYFDGRFLAYAIVDLPGFAPVLGGLLPTAEYDRLLGLAPAGIGDGPFSVGSPLFIAASNAVYLLEITVAPLLLLQRTRRIAVLAAFALVVVIESAALQIGFGLLFANVLLLFLRANWNRRAIPIFAAAYLVLLAEQLLFPGGLELN